MNVASIENCKRLYELSRWNTGEQGSLFYVYQPNVGKRRVKQNAFIDDRYKKMTFEQVCERYGAETMDEVPECFIPAYDSGYLLRKLLPVTQIEFVQESDGKILLLYYPEPLEETHLFAVTPEDALCLLAIKLLEENILSKEA